MQVGLFGFMFAIIVASWLAYRYFKGNNKNE